jgi:hypothetical protein
LKLSFNKSGQNWFSAPEKAFSAAMAANENRGRVMATFTSASLSAPATSRGASSIGEFRALWRQFFARAFNPYRPELHYMRGPGPAWRAKHMARSN